MSFRGICFESNYQSICTSRNEYEDTVKERIVWVHRTEKILTEILPRSSRLVTAGCSDGPTRPSMTHPEMCDIPPSARHTEGLVLPCDEDNDRDGYTNREDQCPYDAKFYLSCPERMPHLPITNPYPNFSTCRTDQDQDGLIALDCGGLDCDDQTPGRQLSVCENDPEILTIGCPNSDFQSLDEIILSDDGYQLIYVCEGASLGERVQLSGAITMIISPGVEMDSGIEFVSGDFINISGLVLINQNQTLTDPALVIQGIDEVNLRNTTITDYPAGILIQDVTQLNSAQLEITDSSKEALRVEQTTLDRRSKIRLVDGVLFFNNRNSISQNYDSAASVVIVGGVDLLIRGTFTDGYGWISLASLVSLDQSPTLVLEDPIVLGYQNTNDGALIAQDTKACLIVDFTGENRELTGFSSVGHQDLITHDQGNIIRRENLGRYQSIPPTDECQRPQF